MTRPLRALTAASLVALGLALAACGSGSSRSSSAASSNPPTLLRETFSASRTVKSGVLRLGLVVTPSGSTELTTPLALSLSGPFQTRGPHQTPESDLTIAVSGVGRTGSLAVITTASAAYLRLAGVDYELPQTDFEKLQRSLTGSGSRGAAPGLATLGIDPERWLVGPHIVGTQTVDGAMTEHVSAGVDVSEFVADLRRLLARESTATSASGVPARIPAATARAIAAAIHDPRVDVWSGRNDSTLRRLTFTGSIPVSGTTSAQLGGLTDARFRLQVDYDELNQSQTIATPSGAQPYSALQAKLRSLGSALQGALGESGATSGGSASAKTSKYARCIESARGDVARMQRCAGLLAGG